MSNVIARNQSAARMPLGAALGLGSGVWDDLLSRSPASGPFMSWAWHRAWAEAAEPDTVDSARVVVLQSATGGAEALFPFRVYRTRFRKVPVTALGWAIGDLGCPDHLELLASPEADVEALVAALEDLPWEVIRLGNVAADASNMQRFRTACEGQGWTVQTNPLWRCPYLQLPESWEVCLSGLGPRWRRTIRRNENKLRRQHHLELTEYGRARLQEGWRHLQSLHAQRWGGGGVFQEPAMERLHRCFAGLLAERDQVWLVTLDVDGAPAAAWYGLLLGDTVYSYQSGWDPRWEGHSVGTVLMSLVIRSAIERGYRTFDFLRGEEPWKTVWTSTARACCEVVVIRAGWRGAVLRGFDWIARQRTKQ